MKKKTKKRKNIGLVPGALIYTGKKVLTTRTVTLIQYNESSLQNIEQPPKLSQVEQDDVVIWYDVRGLADTKFIEDLGQLFGIHPLTLEDILDVNQRPKYEESDDAIFILFHALRYNEETKEIEREQISIYLKGQTVITFQEDVSDLFKPIRNRLQKAEGKIRKLKADYLTYALIDHIVDNYYVSLDAYEENIERLEEEILVNLQQSTKKKIYTLKLQGLKTKKSVSPLREVINTFVKSDHPFIAETTYPFLRDLYDHVLQTIEMNETYRDTVNGLYDLYASEIGFKTNRIIQVLTIVSTVFIPLTFLAGIYGMNFKNMPELEWDYGYFILWGIMIFMVMLSLYFFRRKNWL